MAIDFEKAITILAIALLYIFFVFSIIEVVNIQPNYSDYCGTSPRPNIISNNCPNFVPPPNACNEGYIEYTYNDTGCVVDYTCNTCLLGYETAQNNYNRTFFLLSSFFGIVAIVAGILYPKKMEYITTGFMFGGFMLVFIGTVRYFENMNIYLRPFVMLFELAIVIYAAKKKI